MQIDQSHWKLDDADWVRARKEKWKIVNKWFTAKDEWQSPPDHPRKLHRQALKSFFEKGIADERFSWWLHLSLLHPNITDETVKELIQFNIECGNSSAKGHCLFYALNVYHYSPLVDLGLVTNDDLFVIAKAFCGEDYEDMARLREFVPLEHVGSVMNHHFAQTMSYLTYDEPIVKLMMPQEYFLAHIRSALKFVNSSNIDGFQFRLYKFFKRFEKYKMNGRFDTEEKQKSAEDFYQYLMSDEVDPCIHHFAKNWEDYA